MAVAMSTICRAIHSCHVFHFSFPRCDTRARCSASFAHKEARALFLVLSSQLAPAPPFFAGESLCLPMFFVVPVRGPAEF